jgi:salicylate hydroxylase
VTRIVPFRIKRLLGMASSSSRTRYIKRTHPEDWADESARIVLIGEAAHPFPVTFPLAAGVFLDTQTLFSQPCSMHNCSLAVEDAAVFGALFSRLRSPDQIQVLMEAFQELRQPRCLMAHRAEIANTALLWLPPGQERDARDKKMRKAMLENGKEPDEGRLRQQWEQFGVMFAYCAGEEAEDWWHRWGVLTESSRAMKPLDSLHLKLEVTRVMEVHGDVSKGYYGS